MLVVALVAAAAEANGTGTERGSVAGLEVTAKHKYAYASIFYEIGHLDDEYALGVRVLFASLRRTGSTSADYIVLAPPGISPRYRDMFTEDGLMVVAAEIVVPPSQYKTALRFSYVLTKLAAWRLTAYARVILFDADVIALRRADVAFGCAEFCAVFYNPVNFHTSMLVVRPSTATYAAMVEALARLPSFDGADQGFLNSYYPAFAGAPLYRHNHTFSLTDPVPQPADGVPEMRLGVQLHMHHIYFYEKMSWGGVWGGHDRIFTVTYPIAQFFKPWNWWAYPGFTMHFEWHEHRKSLQSPLSFVPQLLLCAVCLPLLAIAGRLVAVVSTPALRLVPRLPSPRPAVAIVVTVAAATLALAASAVVTLRLVPGIVMWEVAWPTFVITHILLSSLLLGTLRRMANPTVPVPAEALRSYALLSALGFGVWLAASYPGGAVFASFILKIVACIVALLAALALHVGAAISLVIGASR